MKASCIVVKSAVLPLKEGENVLLDDVRRRGYALEEMRVLSAEKENALVSALQEGKAQGRTVFLLADRECFAAVRVLAEGVFSPKTCLHKRENSRLYAEGKDVLCLLTLDDMEESAAFLREVAFPCVEEKNGVVFGRAVVKAVGASVEKIREIAKDTKEKFAPSIRVEHTRNFDEDTIEIFFDGNAPKMAVDEVVRRLVEGLGDTVYALNDESLESQLVALLKMRKKKLSVAESFTGGGIAKRITSVSGASEVYFEGINAYNERSKINRLGVSEYGLRLSGAVSDQTAYQMALGLLQTGDCEFAIATTGLAGPKTDRSGYPVGLAFIAVGTKEKVFVYRYQFDGTREQITEKAIRYALFSACKLLKRL